MASRAFVKVEFSDSQRRSWRQEERYGAENCRFAYIARTRDNVHAGSGIPFEMMDATEVLDFQLADRWPLGVLVRIWHEVLRGTL